MLIQRNTVVAPARRTVKNRAALVLSALLLSAGALAPQAYAKSYPLVDVEVSVKFNLSDLDAEDGTQKVYAKLKRRAVTSCMSDRNTLRYLEQTVAECAADLVDQFVANADVARLTAYHETKLAADGRVDFASLDR
ncbi:MAG: UrcA family protein [Litorimonas sp.]